ncbi:unnamed protein product [Arctia plantaginis]|uniref:tRNA-splicing endonuclease subunit Sen2 n=1 Tax=Arctia plantaginis TaxID=874455 RepID=A0A8S0ZLB1_ARCPL|nr:unnamed protein product [Arctia plantaginis]
MAVQSLRLRFPLDNSMRIVFTGYYNGYNVEIKSVEEMTLLYHMGCFGKGSASRSQPKAAENHNPRIMRKRQYLKRNYWFKKFGSSTSTADADNFMKDVGEITSKIISDCEKKSKKDVIDLVSSDEDNDDQSDFTDEVRECTEQLHSSGTEDIVVVVPNSDSEGENFFENMQPKCCVNKIKTQEKLILSPQEAFFLLYGLGCLQIVNLDNTLLNIESCWDLFTTLDKHFIAKYVVFHYYRSRGYVVKPGIKFGGDYLLYRDGPAISHSDYIVIIRHDIKPVNWIELLGHVRCAHTTVKDIIIAEVIEPEKCEYQSPESLKGYSVREILLNRNLPVNLNEDGFNL